jgi:hypothetical protein
MNEEEYLRGLLFLAFSELAKRVDPRTPDERVKLLLRELCSQGEPFPVHEMYRGIIKSLETTH